MKKIVFSLIGLIVLSFASIIVWSVYAEHSYLYYNCNVLNKCALTEKYYLNTDFVEYQQLITIGVEENTYNYVNVGDKITIRVDKIDTINSHIDDTIPHYEFVCVNN